MEGSSCANCSFLPISVCGRPLFVLVFLLLNALLWLAALPTHAQILTAVLDTGHGPSAVAVNPVTNTIYVTNHDSNTVTVIDGATNSTMEVKVGQGLFSWLSIRGPTRFT